MRYTYRLPMVTRRIHPHGHMDVGWAANLYISEEAILQILKIAARRGDVSAN